MGEEQSALAVGAALRLGAVCLAGGSVIVAGCRLAHGDLPAADAPAALAFITGHPFYAGVHIGTVLGAFIGVAGLVAVTSTFTHGFGRLLARLGIVSAMVGVTVLSVEHSIDGVTGQGLAAAWASSSAGRQADLELAAQTAFQMLRGPSLIGILLLWGVTPMLVSRAARLERYPAWLYWIGLAVGAATVVSCLALLLREDLFPGVLLYGLLASILVQSWAIALGVIAWIRARSLVSGSASEAAPHAMNPNVPRHPRD
jgi:hypothetical protein